MATLTRGEKVTVDLAVDEKLTVVTAAASAGSATRLPDGTYTVLSAASTTTVFGTFTTPKQYLITCSAGSLTYTIAHADLAALKAAAVAALTDSSGGTPAETLVAVGATNTGDRSTAINANFASLNAKFEALKTAMIAAGTLSA